MDISEFTLSYYITILPNYVLYAAITKANEYFNFDNFEVPSQFKYYPIECIFCVFDKDGVLVKSAHEQASYLTVKAIINTSPLKLLREVITQHQK